jgi:hypothetical protein
MRYGLVLMLCGSVFLNGCGGGSGMSAESVVWILGTPVLSADGTSFPMEVQITMPVSKHHNNRIEPAPDGTRVIVNCEFRIGGGAVRPHTQTVDGQAVVVVPFQRSDVADVTISVENSQRSVVVEATVEGEVRLVGG